MSVFVVECGIDFSGRAALGAFPTFELARLFCEENPSGDDMRITEMDPLPVRAWERAVGGHPSAFRPGSAWALIPVVDVPSPTTPEGS